MSGFKSMPVGKSSQRLDSFPLDSTFIHKDREAAKAYAAASPVAYEGQIIYAVDGRWPAEIERGDEPYGCLFMITKQRQILQLNKNHFDATEFATEHIKEGAAQVKESTLRVKEEVTDALKESAEKFKKKE